MSRFRDGPAAGAELLLRRAPVYLRIVIDGDNGNIDALDQLDDEPASSEAVHVYKRRGGASVAFLDYRGRQRHLSGRYEDGDYWHLPDVDGEQLRDTTAWRTWTKRAALRQ